jgi:flavin reductase (DIM6/NTAB) family NADH-FMN oxidoreductase RutF
VALSDPVTLAFRSCVGEFATGVTVVLVGGERPAGMTLNSFTSVSLEPLLVLVAVGHDSRTWTALRRERRFSVSILQRHQGEVALAFADRGAPFPSELIEPADGYLVVRDALAILRCSATEMIRAGDHDLAVGSIEGFSHPGGEPLIFHRGRFGGLEADAVVPRGHPIGVNEGAGW